MENIDMQWKALAAIAARQYGAFDRRQAANAGLTARQLRVAVSRGQLRRALSDVHVFASHATSFRQKCAIASLAGGVVSHGSAAALHDLDGFDEQRMRVIDICFERDHKRVMAGFRVHTWSNTDRRDITRVDGIRCTSVARTLVQLGLSHDREVVEMAFESALRRGAPRSWIVQTLERIRRPGPTGYQVLEEILSDPEGTEVVTESALELVVERAIRHPDLPRPIRQHPITIGSKVRRVDLAYPAAKLAVEAHSRRFHFGVANEQSDNARDLELSAAGWEVIYLDAKMAKTPEHFLDLLAVTYHHRCALFRSHATGS